jgi:DNA replication and repair protein RecF
MDRFRNLRDIDFEPSPGITILYGANGQGKTSVLEAIKVASDLRSFRTTETEALIQEGQDAAWLEITTEADRVIHNYRVEFQRTPKLGKTAFIDEKPVRSGTDYLRRKLDRASAFGSFYAFSFDPSEHEIFRGSPGLRRAYFYQSIAALLPDSLTWMKRYGRIIEQKNRLLKEDTFQASVLESLEEPLIEAAAHLRWFEDFWAREINSALPTYQQKIVQQGTGLRIEWSREDLNPPSEGAGIEEWAEHFRRELQRRAREERARRSSLVGPHRDAWEFFRPESELPLRHRASQGETRTALLALKLSEIDRFRHHRDILPVFLIDDLSSELDSERRQFLLNFLEETDLQVFVSSTEKMPLKGRHFLVKEGYLSGTL